MNSNSCAEDLGNDGLPKRTRSPKCACGVPRNSMPAFHKRSTEHDCIHHVRDVCLACQLVAAIERRLMFEVVHGPFIVR